jgi:hypothetical protein
MKSMDEASVLLDIIARLVETYKNYFVKNPKNIIIGRVEFGIIMKSKDKKFKQPHVFEFDRDINISFSGIPVVQINERSIIGLTPN